MTPAAAEQPDDEEALPPEKPLAGFMVEKEVWVKRAACRGLDPSLFVLDQGAPSAKAKRTCAVCVVGAACEDYARRTGSVGIFNGKTFGIKQAAKDKKSSLEIPDATPRKVTKKNGSPAKTVAAPVKRSGGSPR